MSDSTSRLTTQSLDPDLQAGEVVGEFEVEGKIGQGGFGAVFKAVHPLIGKIVAIKVLSRKFSVDPEMVSRFIAEAKAVNQIRNRHIIDIFSFGQLADGRHYYVMEYLEGEPLDQLLEREGKLELAAALPILRAIARALDAAHAKGIAHRDLKPENVFLAKDSDGGYWPKLLDFGIAKLMAGEDASKHKTRTGMPIGTPYYMSPEQCRGKDVDHRTDFYAFGIVAYQMLAGALPFDAEDYMTLLMKQINEEASPPSRVNPALPAGIDDAIAWLMKKDPAERPPNLATAMRALDEVAEQAGIAVPAAPLSTPIAAVTPRPSSLAAAAAAVATTMPSGLPVVATAPAPAATRRGRMAIVAGLLGALVIGAVVFFAVLHRPGAAAPASPPPATAARPEPTRPVAPAARPQVTAPAAHPQPAQPPPQPADVQVLVEGAPAGTEVRLGRAVLGTTPGAVRIPRGTGEVSLELRRPGYLPEVKKLVPDHDQTLAVTLHRRAAAGVPKKRHVHDSHDIEDPFDH